MAGSFQSIFRRKSKNVLTPPGKLKPLMRVLEPRILLDAAAVETALDIAGQAAHSQLADDFLENNQQEGLHDNGRDNSLAHEDSPAGEASIDLDELDGGLLPRRSDQEIVFVDAGVDNYEELIASLEPGVTIHILDSGSDGVQQMAELLEDSKDYSAIHIFSHGVAGSLQLGNAQLDVNSIGDRHAQALKTIGQALSDNGDILIYGCDFGQGELGRLAASRLASATGADIAASDDLTGSESLAGDWDLEVRTGTIEREAFTAPDWNGILAGYKFVASAPPIIGHLDGGIVGTNGTTALWVNAVEYDPGGGAPLEYFDIQATLIGVSEDVSATFESVTAGNGISEDFRVVVTNIGSVVNNVGGQDVLEFGEVSVRWSILQPGTQLLAPTDKIEIILRDLDGLAGQVDTQEGVTVESENISSYTLESATVLDISVDPNGMNVFGTVQGNNAPTSQISFNWESANNFVVTYVSRTLQTNFDMGGHADLGTYVSPDTIATQKLDLNGPDGAGDDYIAIYANGATAGSDEDVALSIADLDVTIFDLDNDKIVGATVELTNVFPGDQLNYDETLLNKLGLIVDFTQVPDLPAVANQYILNLSGEVLISNYLTAIQSITYSNVNPDPSFNQTTPRLVDVSITDGIHVSSATTTIIIGVAGDAPIVGNNIYVEDEDIPIVASVANGLLADDRDKNGDDLDIVGVTDSTGVSLVDNGLGFWVNPVDGGGNSSLANGATLSINKEDGSFTYTPAAYYSGNETFSYSVSDGTFTRQGFVTFDVQPIANDVTMNIVAPDPTTDPGTDEDQQTQSIIIDGVSPDVSETQIYEAVSIPFGVILTDGVNTFQSNSEETDVDITTWDRSQIRVLPVENSDAEILITFIVTNFEVDGSWSDDSQTVTFKVNAVADSAELIVNSTAAGIDEDVNLSPVIHPSLFDIDGSESITDITLSNIPTGGRIFISGTEVPVVAGTVVFSLIDLDALVFKPPQTGAEETYDLAVSVTTTEVNPNGDVSVLSTTTPNVVLTVELNDNDNPVVAVDDAAVTFAGESVTIDVLINDFIPDGSPLITHVNGLPIDTPTPVTLAGGEGVVSLGLFGQLVFNASANFAGEVSFTYTVQDIDLSVDTATVTVKVQPRWSLSSDPVVIEGADARFTIAIEGAVAQGDSISTDVVLQDISSIAADHATLVDSINNSITNFGQTDFAFDGTTLTYTAPDANYGNTFNSSLTGYIDISSSGSPLSLGDDGVNQRSLGFDFDFYGKSFSSVYIAANGYLTFGSPGIGPMNETLDGSALSGRPIIAPFWDDLDTTSGSVLYETLGIQPGSRQFIVQWEGVTNKSDGAGQASFQVILNEVNGEIWFNYLDIEFDGVGDDGAGASIGLQSSSGIADEFSFDTDGSVANGSSIVFTRGATPNPQLLIDVPIVDDVIFELDENFFLKLENAVDSAFGSDNATVTIAVSDNQAPTAFSDVMSVSETGTKQINIINPDATVTGEVGEDTDPEGQYLHVSELNGVSIVTNTIVTLASGAKVTVNLDGTIEYDPSNAFAYLAEGETTTDTFSYKVSDVFDAQSMSSSVTVTITGVNQAPEIDLNDDGSSLDRSFYVEYLATATTINLASGTASILDPDDNSFGVIHMTLGGFLQASNEIIHIGDVSVPFQSPASSQTAIMGGVSYSVAYDGANALTITKAGGGALSDVEVNNFVRSVLYENDSADDTPGIRSINFSVDDVEDMGLDATVSIQVIGNNNPPDAVDDAVATPYVTIEDTSILIPLTELTANDTELDFGDSFTVISVDGGVNGTAVLDGNGNVFFTPASDFVGSTSFSYTIRDNAGATDTAAVFVDVTPVNDAPRIDLDGGAAGNDYSFVYSENDLATSIIGISGFLIDVDNVTIEGAEIIMAGGQIGDILEVGTLPAGITATSVPVIPASGLVAPGMVTITLTGTAITADYETAIRSITFFSTSNIPLETDRIVTVTATDGQDISAVVTTTISVSAINDAPDTLPDGPYSLDEDTYITITTTALTTNDSDAENDTLTITSVQSPSNGGTVGFNGIGDVVYSPAPNYFGPASFTYTVADGNGGETTEIVNLTIISVNDVTVIDLDSNTAGTGYSTSYIENAAPIALVDASFSIVDIDDVNIESATITLANGFIGDVLDVPTLLNGVSLSISPAMPLVANGTVTVTLTGAASLSEYETMLRSATFFIASDAPSSATRNIIISVDDGDDVSNIGITDISVTAVNDAPVAVDDNSITFDEDTQRIITPIELMGNDFDPDLEPFTMVSVQSAINGTAVLNGNGTVTFTPLADYFGAASFTYTIDDGNGEQATATVNLTIASVNDLTVVDLDTTSSGAGFSIVYNEDDTVGVALVDSTVLLQDIDDSQLESASFVLSDGQIGDELIVGTLPAGLTVSIAPGGALPTAQQITLTISGQASLVDYQLALQAVSFRSDSQAPTLVSSTRSVVVTVNDGDDNSAQVSTAITIIPSNDAPIVGNDLFNVAEDAVLTINSLALLANDQDPDGDTIQVVAVANATNGTVSLSGGVIVFTPAPDYFGPATFEYTVDDGNGSTVTGLVNITVDAVNDAPIVDLNSSNGGTTSFATAYTEGGAGAVISDASVLLADVDSAALTSATIVLTNGQVGDILAVGSLPSGITATISPPTALAFPGSISVTLNGSASFADYQTALQSVRYLSQSNDPSIVDRMISVTVSDGQDNSLAALTTVVVTSVNDAPVGSTDGPFSLDEDSVFSISTIALLLNDTDGEDDPLQITSVGNAVNGTVLINGSTITFNPDANYSGNASFEYTVIDGNGGSDVVTVDLIVNEIADAPIVDLDSGTAGSDFTVAYTENDPPAAIVDPSIVISDIDSTMLSGATVILTNGQVGDVLSAGVLPAGITATFTPATPLLLAGQYTIELTGVADAATYQMALQALNYGTVSNDPSTTDRAIFITVNDGSINSVAVVTTVSVTPANDAPVAGDDGVFTFDEDNTFTINASALMFNDTDSENDPFDVVSVQGAVNGSVTMAADGAISFVPDADYFGPASFTYTVLDINGGADTATVNLNVNSLNDAPIFDANASTSGVGHTASYLENDPGLPIVDATAFLVDVDNADLASATFILANGRIGDVLEIGALPPSISVVVTPSSALIVDGTITVTLTGVASQADYLTALEAVTYRSVSDNPNFTTRSITLTVSDGVDTSPIATTLISVNVVNDAPVAGADGVFAFDEDTVLSLPATSLLLNDSDPEGDDISLVSVQGAVNGSVSLGADNIVRFTPDTAYHGPASFTYTIRDSNGAETTQTVSLDVLFLNDAPIVDLNGANSGADFITNYDENSVGISIADPGATIFDEDHLQLQDVQITLINGRAGDVLEVGSLPASISASVVPGTGLNADGTILVVLSGAASQADYTTALLALRYHSSSENPNVSDRLIEITAFDGLDRSSVAITKIVINSINDAPVAIDDGSGTPLSVTEDTTYTFDPVSSNDFDVEGDNLAITGIDGVAITAGSSVPLAIGGSVELGLDGVTLTYSPALNFNGPLSFDYTLSDGSLNDTATIHLNVVAVNDAPQVVDDGPVVLVEDGAVSFDPVTPNDSDVEADPLNIVSIDGQVITPLGSVTTNDGVLTLQADGRTLNFVPNAQFFGQSIVSYGVSDGEHTRTADITFDVTGIDDPIILVSTPSDQIYHDNETINFSMADFIDDPDGDALVYTASGLPNGLVIDVSTGMIQGVVNSSASQSGPYPVTVGADDGNGSTVSLNFNIDVLNVAPVSNGDVVLPLNDGALFTINTSAFFTNGDGDSLAYAATGLPTWASINPVTGEITGTVTNDASVFGSVPLNVSVDDGEGGTSTVLLTLEPQNLAPITVATINDQSFEVGAVVDLDIAGQFIDGGTDSDALVISVSGLPNGLSLNASGDRIIGTIANGSGSLSAYVVSITADDGQGGMSTQSFSIQVNSQPLIEDKPNNDATQNSATDDGEKHDSTSHSLSVSQVIGGISDLNSTKSLDIQSGILLSAVGAIDPLYEATSSGSDEGTSEQIGGLGDSPQSTNWLNASGREGNGDWVVAGDFGYPSLVDEKMQRDAQSVDERLNRVSIDVSERRGTLLIEFANKLNPERDGFVIKTMLLLPDGTPLPEWMKLVREGVISAKPPVGKEHVTLELIVTLGNGNELRKTIHVDLVNGRVVEHIPQPQGAPEKTADDGEVPTEKLSKTGISELRGSLEAQVPA